MLGDEDRSQTPTQSQELRGLMNSSPSSMGTPGSVECQSLPTAAVTCGSHVTRAGAPAWKALAGSAAQEGARGVERLRGCHRTAEAGELLEQLMASDAVEIMQ